MIAIYNDLNKNAFHYQWIKYCELNKIDYKLVNSYDSNIINQLNGCTSFMWQFSQSEFKDIVMAKSLFFALEQTGLKTFPNFNTAWHFDDKIGQKYLLESLQIDIVKTWVFYDSKAALQWITETNFPKVFKLRGGASSQNVRLITTKSKAKTLVKKAFGKGFSAYNSWGSFKERVRLWRLGKTDFYNVIKGIARLIIIPRYAKVMGNEMSYLYFQEFIPNNEFDTRIIVIDGKAFGIKRMNRENDFRASGSGFILYDKASIDEVFVKTAFDIHKKLKAQCIAYDFVYDELKKPLLIEISYGFASAGYKECVGYWDEQMKWYEGTFNPYGWMVELMLKDEK